MNTQEQTNVTAESYLHFGHLSECSTALSHNRRETTCQLCLPAPDAKNSADNILQEQTYM